MAEYLDICDETGLPVGGTVLRSEAHAKGICHRTAHVWIARQVEGRYQLLLQKRSSTKDSFPGQYDTSSAGHIPAGDEPVSSALRELQEELGIEAAAEDLQFAGTFRIQYETEFYGKPFRDNETAFVYVYTKPVDTDRLTLQQEEVEAVHWFDLEEIWQARRLNADWLCVPRGGLQLVRSFLGADRLAVDKLLIRPAQETDFPSLRQIYLETRKKTFTWQDTETFTLEEFDEATCGEKIITAVWGGEIAGFATVWKPNSFIHCLYVSPKFQGKGIGRGLLDYVTAAFPRPLMLKCLQQNERALAFYQAYGWRITGSGGEGAHTYFHMQYDGKEVPHLSR